MSDSLTWYVATSPEWHRLVVRAGDHDEAKFFALAQWEKARCGRFPSCRVREATPAEIMRHRASIEAIQHHVLA